MNILPKKRWHVRTKDNIARVRRDEAKAAEEAKELEKRIKLADQEARTSYLRKKAQEKKPNLDELGLEVFQGEDKQLLSSSDTVEHSSSVLAPSGHVNFFQHLEEGESTSTTNKDRENEEKKEKEEYEKKIGLLTYLGQDTHELTGEKSWWQKIPENREVPSNVEEETNDKQKKNLDILDPLSSVRMHLGCKGVQKIVERSETKEHKHLFKKKKRKRRSSSSCDTDEEKSKKKSKKRDKDKNRTRKHSSDLKRKKKKKSSKHKSKKKISKNETSTDDSESDSKSKKRESKDGNPISEKDAKRLKLERLRMERIEREKKSKARRNELLYGSSHESKKGSLTESKASEPNRKYNSQFNPQFAKQNKLDASKKYWLQ